MFVQFDVFCKCTCVYKLAQSKAFHLFTSGDAEKEYWGLLRGSQVNRRQGDKGNHGRCVIILLSSIESTNENFKQTADFLFPFSTDFLVTF